MKLTALKTFRHGANVYRRGASVTMSDAQAKGFIGRKLVAETKLEAKTGPKPRAKKSDDAEQSAD
ncbi:hypothetical protein GA830_12160 [Mesorhizobium sp. NBSH29]|uniref:hypothetical protein n=1 Tax=Mesorhizobium sp. NBSH29 TaxID=2654249 RepID=UPI001896646A|nr:hypothetical protein [Mesorhizobium sp. NBSH29]QPC87411.1 hypothetical protein GA830_12160 [Mesorhizobium sp. NBSH29]